MRDATTPAQLAGAVNIALGLTCYELIDCPLGVLIAAAIAGEEGAVHGFSDEDPSLVMLARVALATAIRITEEAHADTTVLNAAHELLAGRIVK